MEVALPPRQAVLLWLAEAHAHGSLPAYARWLIEHPEQVHPLVRITEQVTAATRAAMRGSDREDVSREIARSIRHACILFALVLRIETATDDLVRLHAPLLTALASCPTATRKARALDVAATLDAHERGIRSLQAEHLGGAESLFPETVAAWSDLVARARAIAGRPTGTDARPDAAPDLLDAARGDARELVGETLVAATICARRLR